MMAHRIVGKPIGRVDGIEKVSGEARYAGDVTLPGLVWGKALRSPLPHARIVRIDPSRARRLSGVLAVLTAKDLPDILVGRRMFDMPVLAGDRVRFIGEKVAVAAATDPDLAEEQSRSSTSNTRICRPCSIPKPRSSPARRSYTRIPEATKGPRPSDRTRMCSRCSASSLATWKPGFAMPHGLSSTR